MLARTPTHTHQHSHGCRHLHTHTHAYIHKPAYPHVHPHGHALLSTHTYTLALLHCSLVHFECLRHASMRPVYVYYCVYCMCVYTCTCRVFHAGEAMPVAKSVGDVVIGATVNAESMIIVQVTKVRTCIHPRRHTQASTPHACLRTQSHPQSCTHTHTHRLESIPPSPRSCSWWRVPRRTRPPFRSMQMPLLPTSYPRWCV